MFGLSLLHPWFLAGAVLVGAPILIHLLNKRHFRILDWAAMDFLLEADRKNRRRIQLEEWLLLLLRCLAVLLLAMLIARPLLKPTGLVGSILPSAPMERIILLDDSPSMTVVVNGRSLFEQAVAGVSEFAKEVARQRSADRLTILLTSRPNQPLVVGVGTDQLANILQALQSLKASDFPAQMDQALAAVDQQLQSPQGLPNRSLYVVSDLRKRDWDMPSDVPAARTVPGMLAKLAAKTRTLVVVDVGELISSNLAVTELTSLEKTLVAGVESRFQATVANTGQADASDVEIALKVGDAPEQRVQLASIKAGDKASATFTTILRQAGAVSMTAQLGPDAMAMDNVRYLAAQVQPGVRVLLVDGDPASQRGQGQAFYLRHALGSAGQTASGNLVEVMADHLFETLPLDRFQVIFLCNVYRLSPARIESLQNWVKAGGGLVFFLGEQCDARLYNDLLYQEGKGLLPAKLLSVTGDPQRRQTVRLSIDKTNHPLLAVFEGSQNPFVQGVKVYRWWTTVPPAVTEDAGSSAVATQTLVGLTDASGSPALLQKPFGAGQVLAFTFPADADWSNWPSDPSFVITALELVRYASRSHQDQSSLPVGAPIRYELDPQRHRIEARLIRPDQETATVTALEIPEQPGRMVMQYPSVEATANRISETARAGIYSLELTRLDDSTEVVRFAANVDAGESLLEPADHQALRKPWEGTPIQIVRGKASLGLAATGIGRDLWTWILAGVVAVLAIEQFLAWTFGRKR